MMKKLADMMRQGKKDMAKRKFQRNTGDEKTATFVRFFDELEVDEADYEIRYFDDGREDLSGTSQGPD